MKAMALSEIGPMDPGRQPLRLVDLPVPEPGPGEILIRISACGVCHTELDEIEGRLMPPRLPVVPGHEVMSGSLKNSAKMPGFLNRVFAWVSAGFTNPPANGTRT